MFRTARTLNVYIILLFTNKIKSQPVIEANRMIARILGLMRTPESVRISVKARTG